MGKLRLAACCLMFLAGCDQPAAGPPPQREEVKGPGRFTHSVIQKTSAPWDGPATQLYLSEHALVKDQLAGPLVSIGVYRDASELSKQHVRVEKERPQGAGISRVGAVSAIDAEGKGLPISWAEIDFDEVRPGAPVTGIYSVAFANGKIERGRFQAKWWPKEGGRGG